MDMCRHITHYTVKNNDYKKQLVYVKYEVKVFIYKKPLVH